MGMDPTALFKISYGIYLIGATGEDGKKSGCLVNTVFQLTANPARIGVSVAKGNMTHDVIEKKGTVAVTVIGEAADYHLLGPFGYRSSRDVDKFEGVAYHIDVHGDPLVDEHAVSQLSCTVEKAVDMDTHTLYICRVDEAENVPEPDSEQMTYKFYREVRKGHSSKFAPTYVEPSKN